MALNLKILLIFGDKEFVKDETQSLITSKAEMVPTSKFDENLLKGAQGELASG